MKFIYVLNRKYMEMLDRSGYTLLRADEQNSLWVFMNDGFPNTLGFSLYESCPYTVFSDTLSL